jgi:hypothetical protein
MMEEVKGSGCGHIYQSYHSQRRAGLSVEVCCFSCQCKGPPPPSFVLPKLHCKDQSERERESERVCVFDCKSRFKCVLTQRSNKEGTYF